MNLRQLELIRYFGMKATSARQRSSEGVTHITPVQSGSHEKMTVNEECGSHRGRCNARIQLVVGCKQTLNYCTWRLQCAGMRIRCNSKIPYSQWLYPFNTYSRYTPTFVCRYGSQIFLSLLKYVSVCVSHAGLVWTQPHCLCLHWR